MGSFHLHPTIDAANKAGSSLHIHNNDGNCGELCVDPAKADPSRICGNCRGNKIQERRLCSKSFCQREQRHKLQPDNIGTFFHWENPLKIPDEIIYLNTLYNTCIKIGKLTIFYDLLKCVTKDSYKAKKKNFDRSVFDKWKRSGVTVLKLLFPFVYFSKFVNALGVTEELPLINQTGVVTCRKLDCRKATFKF